MQEVLNAGWYADNEMRSYPLAAGSYLPTTLLADVRLYTPEVVFLSGVTCTPHLMSAVFVFGDGTLAAAVTVSQPVVVGRHYVPDVTTRGVTGAIVFGSGARKEFGKWVFPEGHALDPGCLLRHPEWPVTSVGKQYGTGVSGAITLASGTDLTIRQETVCIGSCRADGGTGNYVPRTAYVFRLESLTGDDSVFTAYAPRCAMRPATDTCVAHGIRSIGGAAPDACGNLEIICETEVPDATLDCLALVEPPGEIVCYGNPNGSQYPLTGSHIAAITDTRVLRENRAWTRDCAENICEECDDHCR